MTYLVSPQYGNNQSDFRPSIYETVVPGGFSEEMNQHFTHHFSGSQLDSIWTLSHVVGTGSGAMNDAENGGYRITCDSSNFDRSAIHFNDINHYSETGSVFIGTWKAVGLISNICNGGLVDQGAVSDYAISVMDTVDTNFKIQTRNGVSATSTASSIAKDTSPHTHRVELQTTSALYYIDGNLEGVDAGSTLPTTTLEPFFQIRTRSNSARDIDVLECEVYNT